MRFISSASMVGALILSSSMVLAAEADANSEQQRPPETLGYVEWVVMKDTNLRLKARLDTGAKTSVSYKQLTQPTNREG